MAEEPFKPRGGISVTIKADEPGGKYNDPKSPGSWLVFHGTVTQVREQIVEAFDMDESALMLSLVDVVSEATDLFKATSTVSSQLGGKVLNDGKGAAKKPAPKSQPKSEDKGDVWEQAKSTSTPDEDEAAEASPATDPILTALEQCKTVAEVQQVWAENQSVFSANADYMAAYKARGKALS